MCGVYSFILFVPMGWFLALIAKLAFSPVVTLATFGFGNKKTFGKTIGVFYIVSFLMGGVTVAVMYATKVPGMAGNGSVYLHGLTYLQIAAGVFSTYLLGSWFVRFMKGKLQKDRVMTDLSVEIAEQKWEMRAFVDTGNFLCDPISGNPAIVLSKSCGKRLLKDLLNTDEVEQEHWPDSIACRQCVIPYKSVGRHGVMQGLRPDRIIVGGRKIDKIVLAISDEDFNCLRGEESYEVLLQQQIIEEEA